MVCGFCRISIFHGVGGEVLVSASGSDLICARCFETCASISALRPQHECCDLRAAQLRERKRKTEIGRCRSKPIIYSPKNDRPFTENQSIIHPPKTTHLKIIHIRIADWNPANHPPMEINCSSIKNQLPLFPPFLLPPLILQL